MELLQTPKLATTFPRQKPTNRGPTYAVLVRDHSLDWSI
jgi:hypothetical protein